jgi:broad specificity phosphatase PhoE
MEAAYADAMLTAKGRQQAQELHDLTKGTIQQTADLIVSSVVRDQRMRRMMDVISQLINR